MRFTIPSVDKASEFPRLPSDPVEVPCFFGWPNLTAPEVRQIMLTLSPLSPGADGRVAQLQFQDDV